MNFEKLTYYAFGWLVITCLNLGMHGFKTNQMPRWFWGVGCQLDSTIPIIWCGIFTVAWWREINPASGKRDIWIDWNID